jgi:hypothetical protein
LEASGAADVAVAGKSTRAIAGRRLEHDERPLDDVAMRTSPSPKRVDCPLAAPSHQTTYARVLHSACLILGGVPQLASHLGVSEATMRAWLEGRDEPSHDVFLAGVEVILLHLDTQGPAS